VVRMPVMAKSEACVPFQTAHMCAICQRSEPRVRISKAAHGNVAHVQHLPPEDNMCPFSNAAHAQLFKSLRTIRHGHGRAQQSTRGHDVLLRLLGLGQPSVGDVL
jgi:hypothetical protein